MDAAHLYCTECGTPMPGLCPNGHVVQPAQRYCTVCGIGLLGLAPGPLALPPGPDPHRPPWPAGKVEEPTNGTFSIGALPAPVVSSPGSHRPGSSAARQRRSRFARR